MSKAFWPAGKASIILLPSGTQGEGLFSLAKSWAEAGLLGPAFWIFPEKIKIHEDQPPFVNAAVLGVNSDRSVIEIEVDLFEQLARENLAVVRLIKLRAATPARQSDELQDEIVQHIENYLGWSMPGADGRSSDKDPVLDYQPVNLICVPTEFKTNEKESFSRMRNGTTVIAAPEDRTTPWSSDAFVRDDERFAGFTLMHLATVSGIWHGLPVGTLELFNRERSAMQQVWISRVFYSGVFTDGLARRVAATFVEDVAKPGFESVEPPAGTAFIDPMYEHDYIDVMVQSTFLLDESTLEYRRPELPGDPLKNKIGILKQLAEFLVFLARKLGRLPFWIWMALRRRVSKKVEASLQGESGALQVGLGLEEKVDIYDRQILSNWRIVETEQKVAQDTINGPIKLAQIKTTHSLWQQLRELVFGALDGGFDLSWAGFPLIDGERRPVFQTPDSVFPIEKPIWVAPHPLPDRLTSDHAGRLSNSALLLDLEKDVLDLQSELEPALERIDELSEKLEAHNDELDILWTEIKAVQGFKVNSKGEEVPLNITEATKLESDLSVSASSDDDERAADQGLVSKIRRFKQLQDEKRALAKELDEAEKFSEQNSNQLELQRENLESLRKFQEEVNRTYQARVSEGMESRLQTVRDDQAHLKEALNNLEAPDLGRLVGLRKQFHRSIAIALGVVSVVFGLYLALYFWNEPSGQPNWPTVLESTLIALATVGFVVTWLGANYYRGWSELQRAVTLQHADVNRIVNGYRASRSEENRLSVLYSQTSEWLELIREAVLKPWQVRESWKESNLRSLDLEKLPFAMRVAQAQDDQEAPMYILRSAASQHVFVRGWRNKAFEALIAEVAKISGKGSTFRVDSLDRDLPHASNGARRLMRDFMSQDSVLERVAARQIKPVIEKLQGESMSAARPKVMESDSDPLSPLRTDPESIVEYEPEQEWADFLSKSLTLGPGTNSPTTPLSALAIGEAHIQSGEHEGAVGHILLPSRIAGELPTKEATNVAIFPHKEATPAPVDAVIRVDVVGPLELGITRIMSGDSDVAGNEGDEEIKIRGKLFD